MNGKRGGEEGEKEEEEEKKKDDGQVDGGGICEIMCARLLVTRGPCEGNPIFFSFSPFAPSLACREDEAEKSSRSLEGSMRVPWTVGFPQKKSK